MEIKLIYTNAWIFLNLFFRRCISKVIIKYDLIEIRQYIPRGAMIVFPVFIFHR